ncbi:hypothetical protein BD413DRAFT_615181 [Trametes elegans]|nr:hypothetical protein BD413DRAFT_615181 [Trametes elegans]
MPEPIVFYDIPGTAAASKAWSHNTWKTRYSLNFKGIPYKTIWVEYPDIEPVLRKIGAAPTSKRADGSPLYTLPAILDPNTGTALTDSSAIARYLDRTYPDAPRLLPAETDALHEAFIVAFQRVIFPDLRPILVPSVAELLPPRSTAYFYATREPAWGGKLSEVAPRGSEKREKHWAGVKAAFNEYTKWLEADGSDKLFFLGKDKIAYADIFLAAYLAWIRIILGPDSEEWADLLTWNGGRWARFAEAFEKYGSVDAGEDAVV